MNIKNRVKIKKIYIYNKEKSGDEEERVKGEIFWRNYVDLEHTGSVSCLREPATAIEPP